MIHEALSILLTVLKSVAYFYLSFVVFNFLIRIGPIIYAGKTDYSKYGANKGAWVLITGPTDGIGYEFALQYADRGFNIMGVARNKERLEHLKTAIEAKGRLFRYVVVDFAKATQQDFTNVETVAKSIDVRIVVFNAGISHKYPKMYVDEDKSVVDDMININIKSVLELTRILIPLVKRPGMFVTIGSVTAKFPAVYLSVYTATKAFIKTFSRAMSAEYRGSGLHFEVLEPYYVATKMAKIRANWIAPSPEDFVKFVIARLGTNFEWVPYPTHAIFGVLRILPDSIIERIGYQVNSQIMAKIRRKAKLRKEAEERALESEATESNQTSSVGDESSKKSN